MLDWMNKHSREITWFIIGLCSFSALINLVAGNYAWGMFNAFLAVANLYMVRR